MVTVIICISLIIIFVCAVKSYTRKLVSGCCENGKDSLKEVKVQDNKNESYS